MFISEFLQETPKLLGLLFRLLADGKLSALAAGHQ